MKNEENKMNVCGNSIDQFKIKNVFFVETSNGKKSNRLRTYFEHTFIGQKQTLSNNNNKPINHY